VIFWGIAVRIDKFLKVSRLIKRRTVANEACGASRVSVNGKPVKPSKELKIGDKVSIMFGSKTVTFEVLSLTAAVKKDEASEMYRILEEA
jgi:ribosomal 50S subunit-recycling heat shock protein